MQVTTRPINQDRPRPKGKFTTGVSTEANLVIAEKSALIFCVEA